ncbi:MAG: hypothetical protein H6601_11140 [Flavobacteriales bacterium]|nr:hypothetical protein [Flavobacteriales bacterium]
MCRAKEELEKAYTAALDGGLTAKSEQRQKNIELDNALRPLRDYVNEVAMGDEVTVLKSGFEISKLPSRWCHAVCHHQFRYGCSWRR